VDDKKSPQGAVITMTFYNENEGGVLKDFDPFLRRGAILA